MMPRLLLAVALAFLTTTCHSLYAADAAQKEQVIEGPWGMAIVVRAQAPYDADVPLQAVCLFKHKASGDKMLGAASALDQHLRGAITTLRSSGQFEGDEMETFLLVPPEGMIKPKALLLVGLGEESKLSTDIMQRVGQTVLREATRLRAHKVAFAPVLRDQGNDTLSITEVETAVMKGMLLAYDTQTRIRKDRLAEPYTLETWVVEAGAAFFDETVAGVQQGVNDAAKAAASRPETLFINNAN